MEREISSSLTVGIPYHSKTNPSYFREAIDSIINQTLKPTVVHLVQDGQVSEELSSLVQVYLDTYDFIEKLEIPQNRGLPYALNYSILNCKTKYYARMDDDDIAFHDRFEKQIAFLEENPEIHIIGSWAVEFDDEGETRSEFLRKVPLHEKHIRHFFHYRSPFVHPTVMFRKKVFARLGLYNCSYTSSQDIELWARALKLNIGVANCPEPLLYYRASNIESKRSDIRSVIRIAKALFSYNTFSPYLNALKLASIIFRIMPASLKKWGYKNLRKVNV